MNQRLILIINLWIRNNDIPAFEVFERRAAKAMAEFGGRAERVIRMSGAEFENDKPFEIHIVSFPSEVSYQMYRQASESRKLAEV